MIVIELGLFSLLLTCSLICVKFEAVRNNNMANIFGYSALIILFIMFIIIPCLFGYLDREK